MIYRESSPIGTGRVGGAWENFFLPDAASTPHVSEDSPFELTGLPAAIHQAPSSSLNTGLFVSPPTGTSPQSADQGLSQIVLLNSTLLQGNEIFDGFRNISQEIRTGQDEIVRGAYGDLNQDILVGRDPLEASEFSLSEDEATHLIGAHASQIHSGNVTISIAISVIEAHLRWVNSHDDLIFATEIQRRLDQCVWLLTHNDAHRRADEVSLAPEFARLREQVFLIARNLYTRVPSWAAAVQERKKTATLQVLENLRSATAGSINTLQEAQTLWRVFELRRIQGAGRAELADILHRLTRLIPGEGRDEFGSQGLIHPAREEHLETTDERALVLLLSQAYDALLSQNSSESLNLDSAQGTLQGDLLFILLPHLLRDAESLAATQPLATLGLYAQIADQLRRHSSSTSSFWTRNFGDLPSRMQALERSILSRLPAIRELGARVTQLRVLAEAGKARGDLAASHFYLDQILHLAFPSGGTSVAVRASHLSPSEQHMVLGVWAASQVRLGFGAELRARFQDPQFRRIFARNLRGAEQLLNLGQVLAEEGEREGARNILKILQHDYLPRWALRERFIAYANVLRLAETIAGTAPTREDRLSLQDLKNQWLRDLRRGNGSAQIQSALAFIEHTPEAGIAFDLIQEFLSELNPFSNSSLSFEERFAQLRALELGLVRIASQAREKIRAGDTEENWGATYNQALTQLHGLYQAWHAWNYSAASSQRAGERLRSLREVLGFEHRIRSALGRDATQGWLAESIQHKTSQDLLSDALLTPHASTNDFLETLQYFTEETMVPEAGAILAAFRDRISTLNLDQRFTLIQALHTSRNSTQAKIAEHRRLGIAADTRVEDEALTELQETFHQMSLELWQGIEREANVASRAQQAAPLLSLYARAMYFQEEGNEHEALRVLQDLVQEAERHPPTAEREMRLLGLARAIVRGSTSAHFSNVTEVVHTLLEGRRRGASQEFNARERAQERQEIESDLTALRNFLHRLSEAHLPLSFEAALNQMEVEEGCNPSALRLRRRLQGLGPAVWEIVVALDGDLNSQSARQNLRRAILALLDQDSSYQEGTGEYQEGIVQALNLLRQSSTDEEKQELRTWEYKIQGAEEVGAFVRRVFSAETVFSLTLMVITSGVAGAAEAAIIPLIQSGYAGILFEGFSAVELAQMGAIVNSTVRAAAVIPKIFGSAANIGAFWGSNGGLDFLRGGHFEDIRITAIDIGIISSVMPHFSSWGAVPRAFVASLVLPITGSVRYGLDLLKEGETLESIWDIYSFMESAAMGLGQEAGSHGMAHIQGHAEPSRRELRHRAEEQARRIDRILRRRTLESQENVAASVHAGEHPYRTAAKPEEASAQHHDPLLEVAFHTIAESGELDQLSDAQARWIAEETRRAHQEGHIPPEELTAYVRRLSEGLLRGIRPEILRQNPHLSLDDLQKEEQTRRVEALKETANIYFQAAMDEAQRIHENRLREENLISDRDQNFFTSIDWETLKNWHIQDQLQEPHRPTRLEILLHLCEAWKTQNLRGKIRLEEFLRLQGVREEDIPRLDVIDAEGEVIEERRVAYEEEETSGAERSNEISLARTSDAPARPVFQLDANLSSQRSDFVPTPVGENENLVVVAEVEGEVVVDSEREESTAPRLQVLAGMSPAEARLRDRLRVGSFFAANDNNLNPDLVLEQVSTADFSPDLVSLHGPNIVGAEHEAQSLGFRDQLRFRASNEDDGKPSPVVTPVPGEKGNQRQGSGEERRDPREEVTGRLEEVQRRVVSLSQEIAECEREIEELGDERYLRAQGLEALRIYRERAAYALLERELLTIANYLERGASGRIADFETLSAEELEPYQIQAMGRSNPLPAYALSYEMEGRRVLTGLRSPQEIRNRIRELREEGVNHFWSQNAHEARRCFAVASVLERQGKIQAEVLEFPEQTSEKAPKRDVEVELTLLCGERLKLRWSKEFPAVVFEESASAYAATFVGAGLHKQQDRFLFHASTRAALVADGVGGSVDGGLGAEVVTQVYYLLTARGYSPRVAMYLADEAALRAHRQVYPNRSQFHSSAVMVAGFVRELGPGQREYRLLNVGDCGALVIRIEPNGRALAVLVDEGRAIGNRPEQTLGEESRRDLNPHESVLNPLHGDEMELLFSDALKKVFNRRQGLEYVLHVEEILELIEQSGARHEREVHRVIWVEGMIRQYLHVLLLKSGQDQVILTQEAYEKAYQEAAKRKPRLAAWKYVGCTLNKEGEVINPTGVVLAVWSRDNFTLSVRRLAPELLPCTQRVEHAEAKRDSIDSTDALIQLHREDLADHQHIVTIASDTLLSRILKEHLAFRTLALRAEEIESARLHAMNEIDPRRAFTLNEWRVALKNLTTRMGEAALQVLAVTVEVAARQMIGQPELAGDLRPAVVKARQDALEAFRQNKTNQVVFYLALATRLERNISSPIVSNAEPLGLPRPQIQFSLRDKQVFYRADLGEGAVLVFSRGETGEWSVSAEGRFTQPIQVFDSYGNPLSTPANSQSPNLRSRVPAWQADSTAPALTLESQIKTTAIPGDRYGFSAGRTLEFHPHEADGFEINLPGGMRLHLAPVLGESALKQEVRGENLAAASVSGVDELHNDDRVGIHANWLVVADGLSGGKLGDLAADIFTQAFLRFIAQGYKPEDAIFWADLAALEWGRLYLGFPVEDLLLAPGTVMTATEVVLVKAERYRLRRYTVGDCGDCLFVPASVYRPRRVLFAHEGYSHPKQPEAPEDYLGIAEGRNLNLHVEVVENIPAGAIHLSISDGILKVFRDFAELMSFVEASGARTAEEIKEAILIEAQIRQYLAKKAEKTGNNYFLITAQEYAEAHYAVTGQSLPTVRPTWSYEGYSLDMDGGVYNNAGHRAGTWWIDNLSVGVRVIGKTHAGIDPNPLERVTHAVRGRIAWLQDRGRRWTRAELEALNLELAPANDVEFSPEAPAQVLARVAGQDFNADGVMEIDPSASPENENDLRAVASKKKKNGRPEVRDARFRNRELEDRITRVEGEEQAKLQKARAAFRVDAAKVAARVAELAAERSRSIEPVVSNPAPLEGVRDASVETPTEAPALRAARIDALVQTVGNTYRTYRNPDQIVASLEAALRGEDIEQGLAHLEAFRRLARLNPDRMPEFGAIALAELGLAHASPELRDRAIAVLFDLSSFLAARISLEERRLRIAVAALYLFETRKDLLQDARLALIQISGAMKVSPARAKALLAERLATDQRAVRRVEEASASFPAFTRADASFAALNVGSEVFAELARLGFPLYSQALAAEPRLTGLSQMGQVTWALSSFFKGKFGELTLADFDRMRGVLARTDYLNWYCDVAQAYMGRKEDDLWLVPSFILYTRELSEALSGFIVREASSGRRRVAELAAADGNLAFDHLAPRLSPHGIGITASDLRPIGEHAARMQPRDAAEVARESDVLVAAWMGVREDLDKNPNPYDARLAEVIAADPSKVLIVITQEPDGILNSTRFWEIARDQLSAETPPELNFTPDGRSLVLTSAFPFLQDTSAAQMRVMVFRSKRRGESARATEATALKAQDRAGSVEAPAQTLRPQASSLPPRDGTEVHLVDHAISRTPSLPERAEGVSSQTTNADWPADAEQILAYLGFKSLVSGREYFNEGWNAHAEQAREACWRAFERAMEIARMEGRSIERVVIQGAGLGHDSPVQRMLDAGITEVVLEDIDSLALQSHLTSLRESDRVRVRLRQRDITGGILFDLARAAQVLQSDYTARRIDQGGACARFVEILASLEASMEERVIVEEGVDFVYSATVASQLRAAALPARMLDWVERDPELLQRWKIFSARLVKNYLSKLERRAREEGTVVCVVSDVERRIRLNIAGFQHETLYPLFFAETGEAFSGLAAYLSADRAIARDSEYWDWIFSKTFDEESESFDLELRRPEVRRVEALTLSPRLQEQEGDARDVYLAQMNESVVTPEENDFDLLGPVLRAVNPDLEAANDTTLPSEAAQQVQVYAKVAGEGFEGSVVALETPEAPHLAIVASSGEDISGRGRFQMGRIVEGAPPPSDSRLLNFVQRTLRAPLNVSELGRELGELEKRVREDLLGQDPRFQVAGKTALLLLSNYLSMWRLEAQRRELGFPFSASFVSAPREVQSLVQVVEKTLAGEWSISALRREVARLHREGLYHLAQGEQRMAGPALVLANALNFRAHGNIDPFNTPSSYPRLLFWSGVLLEFPNFRSRILSTQVVRGSGVGMATLSFDSPEAARLRVSTEQRGRALSGANGLVVVEASRNYPYSGLTAEMLAQTLLSAMGRGFDLSGSLFLAREALMHAYHEEGDVTRLESAVAVRSRRRMNGNYDLEMVGTGEGAWHVYSPECVTENGERIVRQEFDAPFQNLPAGTRVILGGRALFGLFNALQKRGQIDWLEIEQILRRERAETAEEIVQALGREMRARILLLEWARQSENQSLILTRVRYVAALRSANPELPLQAFDPTEACPHEGFVLHADGRLLSPRGSLRARWRAEEAHIAAQVLGQETVGETAERLRQQRITVREVLKHSQQAVLDWVCARERIVPKLPAKVVHTLHTVLAELESLPYAVGRAAEAPLVIEGWCEGLPLYELLERGYYVRLIVENLRAVEHILRMVSDPLKKRLQVEVAPIAGEELLDLAQTAAQLIENVAARRLSPTEAMRRFVQSFAAFEEAPALGRLEDASFIISAAQTGQLVEPLLERFETELQRLALEQNLTDVEREVRIPPEEEIRIRSYFTTNLFYRLHAAAQLGAQVFLLSQITEAGIHRNASVHLPVLFDSRQDPIDLLPDYFASLTPAQSVRRERLIEEPNAKFQTLVLGEAHPTSPPGRFRDDTPQVLRGNVRRLIPGGNGDTPFSALQPATGETVHETPPSFTNVSDALALAAFTIPIPGSPHSAPIHPLWTAAGGAILVYAGLKELHRAGRISERERLGISFIAGVLGFFMPQAYALVLPVVAMARSVRPVMTEDFDAVSLGVLTEAIRTLHRPDIHLRERQGSLHQIANLLEGEVPRDRSLAHQIRAAVLTQVPSGRIPEASQRELHKEHTGTRLIAVWKEIYGILNLVLEAGMNANETREGVAQEIRVATRQMFFSIEDTAVSPRQRELAKQVRDQMEVLALRVESGESAPAPTPVPTPVLQVNREKAARPAPSRPSRADLPKSVVSSPLPIESLAGRLLFQRANELIRRATTVPELEVQAFADQLLRSVRAVASADYPPRILLTLYEIYYALEIQVSPEMRRRLQLLHAHTLESLLHVVNALEPADERVIGLANAALSAFTPGSTAFEALIIPLCQRLQRIEHLDLKARNVTTLQARLTTVVEVSGTNPALQHEARQALAHVRRFSPLSLRGMMLPVLPGATIGGGIFPHLVLGAVAAAGVYYALGPLERSGRISRLVRVSVAGAAACLAAVLPAEWGVMGVTSVFAMVMAGINTVSQRKTRDRSRTIAEAGIASEDTWEIPTTIGDIEIGNSCFGEVLRRARVAKERTLKQFAAELEARYKYSTDNSTISLYETRSGYKIPLAFLEAAHRYFEWGLETTVFLATSQQLDAHPRIRDLALTRSRHFCFLGDPFIAKNFLDLAERGLGEGSFRYLVLVSVSDLRARRSIEEVASASKLTPTMIKKYIEGSQPTPENISALAHALQVEPQVIVKGLNIDRHIIADLRELDLPDDTWISNHHQTRDTELLELFATKKKEGLLEKEPALYFRYRVWRAIKERELCLTPVQASLHFGEHEGYVRSRLHGHQAITQDNLADWVYLFRSLGEDPEAIMTPYLEELGVNPDGFYWALTLGLNGRTLEDTATASHLSADRLGILYSEQGVASLTLRRAVPLLLALPHLAGERVLRATQEGRIAQKVFPELEVCGRPELHLTPDDINGMVEFSFPVALAEAMHAKNINTPALARMLEVDEVTVRDYLKQADRKPGDRVLVRIAEILELPLRLIYLHFHPELLWAFPLRNPKTGKTYRLYARDPRILILAKRIEILPEQARELVFFNEREFLQNMEREYVRVASVRGKRLNPENEMKLVMIWKYHEDAAFRRRAETVIVRAYDDMRVGAALDFNNSYFRGNRATYDELYQETYDVIRDCLRCFEIEHGYRLFSYTKRALRSRLSRWCQAKIKEIRPEVSLEAPLYDDNDISLRENLEYGEEGPFRALELDPRLEMCFEKMERFFQTRQRPDLFREVFLGRFAQQDGEVTQQEIADRYSVSRKYIQILEDEIRGLAERVFADFNPFAI